MVPRSFLPIVLSLALYATSARAGAIAHSVRLGDYWHGWANILKMFVFGDSYTATDFNCTLTQPSPSNPMGNPGFPGTRAELKWVQFLTKGYNASLLYTYNFANPGATIDSRAVKPYVSGAWDLERQMEDMFVRCYLQDQLGGEWTPEESLYVFFFGVNEVNNAYMSDVRTLYPKVFEEYARVLNLMYELGARNFLVLNAPALDVSPSGTERSASDQELEHAAAVLYNKFNHEMVANFRFMRRDATVFEFDVYSLFVDVIRNPQEYELTRGLKNVTNYCKAYENEFPKADLLKPECGVRFDKYFWTNGMHPTFVGYEVMAQEIVKLLV